MSFWSRIKNTLRGNRHRDEIDEELQFHLDMMAAGGEDARHSRLRLGNVTRLSEDTRAIGIVDWLDSALDDARFGLRQLRKTPVLTIAVVLSLAVGLGANTAIFSLVDAAILRPLPVPQPGQLVILGWTHEGFPPGVENINGEFRLIEGGGRRGLAVSPAIHRRLAREQDGFAAVMGTSTSDTVAIAVDAAPADQVRATYVSSNFFQGLGAPPVLGRPFLDEEDRLGAEPAVIVSHRFWVNQLGSSPDVLQRRLRINNVPARIVGVAPPGFFGLKAGDWIDVYAPLAMRVAFQPPPSDGKPRAENDRDWWVHQIARLKPNVPEAAARAQVATLFRQLATPDGMTVTPAQIPELTTLPGRRGFEALNARDTNALWILMLLVAVLLLIVCANVANLLLSRAVSRQRESALRLALGAGRLRLLRQHLIESGVLALLGGTLGLVLGYAIAFAIHRLFQSGQSGQLAQSGQAANVVLDVYFDPRVVLYTGGLAIATALLFGLMPAIRAARADLGETLRSQARSITRGRLRLPRLLVAVQIALCLAALVAAGLLGRTLSNLRWLEVGFDRAHVAYASVSPSRAGYPADRLGPYVDRVRAELARLPGVIRVSPVQTRLLAGGGNAGPVDLPGRPLRVERGMVQTTNIAHLNRVGDGFFETMGIPLVAGRAFEPRDFQADASAVVVDDLFVRRYFPNEPPIGRRFGIGRNGGGNTRYEIVGVVGDSRYNSLRGAAVPTVYQPYSPGGTVHFAIRTTMDPGSLGEAVRRAVAAVDPAVPLAEFQTQDGLIDRILRTERLLGFLSSAFGAIALALAAIGLAGLLAYAVARRTQEIGVRMAMGAAARDVVRMVLRDSLSIVGSGAIVGLPIAYAIGQALRTTLFGLEPLDPVVSALSLAALFAIALVAAWIPARRAARIDPITALRQD